MTELSIVMPAFNEESTIKESIERVISEAEKINISYEILVVNDGSTDATHQRASSVLGPVEVIDQRPNQGKGHSLREGFLRAKGRYVLFLDADLDLDPVFLQEYIDTIEKRAAACIIGSKRHPRSLVNYPSSRRLLSFIWMKLVKSYTGLSVTDTQTGFKLLSASQVRDPIIHSQSKGFAFDIEFLSLVNLAGGVIIEGPVKIDFGFSSSVTLRSGAASLAELSRIAKRLKLERETKLR